MLARSSLAARRGGCVSESAAGRLRSARLNRSADAAAGGVSLTGRRRRRGARPGRWPIASWMALRRLRSDPEISAEYSPFRSSPRRYAGQLRPEPSPCAGRACERGISGSRGCRPNRPYNARAAILSAWHCERNRDGKDFFIIVNLLLTMSIFSFHAGARPAPINCAAGIRHETPAAYGPAFTEFWSRAGQTRRRQEGPQSPGRSSWRNSRL